MYNLINAIRDLCYRLARKKEVKQKPLTDKEERLLDLEEKLAETRLLREHAKTLSPIPEYELTRSRAR